MVIFRPNIDPPLKDEDVLFFFGAGVTAKRLFAIAATVATVVLAGVVAFLSYPKPVRELSADYLTYPSVRSMADNSSHILVGNTSQSISFFALIRSGLAGEGSIVWPLEAYRIAISGIVKGAWSGDHVWVLTNGGHAEYGGVIYRYSDSVDLPVPNQMIVFLRCQEPPSSWSLSIDPNSTFGRYEMCFLLGGHDGYFEIVAGSLRTHDSQTGPVRVIDSEPVDGMALADFIARIAL